MDKIVVVGGGGHAKVLISVLKRVGGYEIVGYTDEVNRNRVLGIEYLGNDSILDILHRSVTNAAIGVGNVVVSPVRESIVNRIKAASFLFPTIISPNAIINEDVILGEGCVVFDGALVNCGTRIGSFAIVNSQATIEHDCLIGHHVHVAPGATICGGVTIGDNTLVGAGATILQHISIGRDILIGAGSVVIEDILSSGTYAGIPARRVDR